jgi:hypothetical protein
VRVTLFNKQNRERLITETLVGAHKANVQSQRVGVMLFGEAPHNYHRIGSSGSNLTCEGLLLVMRAGGHRDPQARASPSEVNHSEPLLSDDICDTPSHFLQGKLATRWSFSLVGVGWHQIRWRTLGAMVDHAEVHPRTRGLKAVMDGAEGHQSIGGPCLWRRSAVDTRHVPIGGA